MNTSEIDPEPEPEELIRFREAWRREVEAKKAQDNHSGPKLDYGPPTSEHTSQEIYTDRQQPGPSSQTIAGGSTASSRQTSHGTTILSTGLTAGLDIYRRAVQHEQQSQLDEALRLYRIAFRIDPNIDKAYHNAEQQRKEENKAAAQLKTSGHKKSSSKAGDETVEEVIRGLGSMTIKPSGAVTSKATGTMASLLSDFPSELTFEPEDEKEGVPLNILPDEMLVLILRCLNPTQVERFAAVNRKARVLTLDSAIWREFVEMAYKPPQIPHAMAMEPVIEEYSSDYRRVYIEHPRVRLDGVYIAVCHYVRAGLSENAWVNISHLITYHRYLRFFPDGQVLSLLANEELDPQQVIPLLKPTLRMKGLFIGSWYLEGMTVYITNLVDASGKNTTIPLANPAATSIATSYSTRYVFQMTLNLRSRPLGRWNKLEFDAYESVDVGSGETIPLSLKHERAFWFSKVRSYSI